MHENGRANRPDGRGDQNESDRRNDASRVQQTVVAALGMALARAYRL